MRKLPPVIIKCAHCGVEYGVQPYRAKESKYCSAHCRAVHAPKREVTRVRVNCEHCAGEYEVIKSRASKTRFCSLKCAADAILRQPDVMEKAAAATEARLAPGREERRIKAKERKRIGGQRYYEENKETISFKSADYYQQNKDRADERSRKWREAHANEITESNRLKRERDGERIRAKRREHYRQNKSRYKAQARRREIDKLQAMPPWADLEAIEAFYIEADRLTRETGIKHHVDHIFPLRGKTSCGLHVPWNLQVLPAEENLKKGNALPPAMEVFAFNPISRLVLTSA